MAVIGRLSGIALECRDPAALAALSMQFHLHLRVEDLDVAEEAVLALGATKFDHQPNPDHSRFFADPAGHPFCLCA